MDARTRGRERLAEVASELVDRPEVSVGRMGEWGAIATEALGFVDEITP
ncbi:hypothetical protein [Agromyces sp. GXS1127]